ncbi:hypothetical protein ACE1CI_14295, partial [Aerosakkonemataceae cyanobacterium BLCC-F50]
MKSDRFLPWSENERWRSLGVACINFDSASLKHSIFCYLDIINKAKTMQSKNMENKALTQANNQEKVAPTVETT